VADGGLVVGPGPTHRTVRDAQGRVVAAPEDWVLLEPGDAALTRRVKAAGDHWLMQEKQGRRTFSRGVWAPEATVERIRHELAAERSTEAWAKKQAQALVSEGGGGPRRSRSVKSSAMPWPDGTRRSGLKDHISDSGTIIVRDQADTRDRFTGNHVGNSTASGGTAGQAE
jgi:hypothetical protein